MSSARLDRAAIVTAIRASMEEFIRMTDAVPYERKGILFSEMLFLKACVTLVGARRLLESGRARAQSTLVLARMFPDLKLVSVEFDRDSPDVPVAAARMAPHAHAELRFGDATSILPAIAEAGDVALIDGPKGHRGVRLALSLLASGKLPMVFVHDAMPGSPERRLFERLLPEALYSDDPAFARETHSVDAAAHPDMAPERRNPEAGYGYSLACIPYRADRNYGLLIARTALDGFLGRLAI